MFAATWPTICLSMPWISILVGTGTTNSMPAGRLDADGVAEAELQVEGARALGRGAVADADDLEVLAESLGHADDHVVDERPEHAVEGTVLALVVGALDDEHVTFLTDGDGAGDLAGEFALGTLDRDLRRR